MMPPPYHYLPPLYIARAGTHSEPVTFPVEGVNGRSGVVSGTREMGRP